MTSKFFEHEDVSLEPGEVREVIEQGRGESTEFEPTIPENGINLAITACALANSGGGQILIGVKKSGEIVGVENFDGVESEAAEILDQNTEGRSDFTYSTFPCEMKEGAIIGIHIRKFDQLPLAVDGRFYRRDRDKNILLRPEEVWRLMPESLSD